MTMTAPDEGTSADGVWTRLRLAPGATAPDTPEVADAAIVVEGGCITYVGPRADLPATAPDTPRHDGGDALVTPGLVDCHTHLVYGGHRANEFALRLAGASYEEIAQAGGGIVSSVRATRAASEDDLYAQALPRLQSLLDEGVCAIEIKSGYGLTVDAELKMLRVIKRIKEAVNFPVKATFLGAHAFPKEYKENHRGYIDLIIREMLPKIAGEKLADYIDVFCERNYFSLEEMEEILLAGKQYGLVPKVHVNQFSVMGGVAKAIELGALSVDHLEEISDEDIEALKGSGCMPTLLPSCSHFISIPFANARKMMEAGLPVALASDFNPGTTPTGNLQVVMSLACVKMKMTPEEAINALTVNAAYAMGISETHGSIGLGKSGNVMLTKEIPSLAYLPYAFGDTHIEQTIGF